MLVHNYKLGRNELLSKEMTITTLFNLSVKNLQLNKNLFKCDLNPRPPLLDVSTVTTICTSPCVQRQASIVVTVPASSRGGQWLKSHPRKIFFYKLCTCTPAGIEEFCGSRSLTQWFNSTLYTCELLYRTQHLDIGVQLSNKWTRKAYTNYNIAILVAVFPCFTILQKTLHLGQSFSLLHYNELNSKKFLKTTLNHPINLWES